MSDRPDLPPAARRALAEAARRREEAAKKPPLPKEHGGRDGAERFLIRVEEQIRAVMLLCGAQNIAQLQQAPRLYGAELKEWMALAEPAG